MTNKLYHPSQAVAIPYNDPFLCGAHLYKHFGKFLSPLASALPVPPQWSDCVCRDDTLLMEKDTWCGETEGDKEFFHKIDSNTLVFKDSEDRQEQQKYQIT